MSSTDSYSSPPSVVEDQPPYEEKQKLESENNKDGEGKAFDFNDETSWRLFGDYGDNDDDDPVDEDGSAMNVRLLMKRFGDIRLLSKPAMVLMFHPSLAFLVAV
ncbi:uncharacterized protein LOC111300358 isoform X1 [Durio zibethinus]|uniref:Uncharacterized protein LOC111300358 isoform X1 n=1 Tax=Durio zibethinus TaxID=66656 RepID=A0A6P5ZFV2_DURZI|nr:uncharacterized protein LOC111300358 isoform X1 [Durio zibethinus]